MEHPSIAGAGDLGPPVTFDDRDNFRTALRAWEEATSRFCIALDAFMNPGGRLVEDATWKRSPGHASGQNLDRARLQRDLATVALDRIVASIRNA
jgi:hypothetical protein